MQNRQIRCRSGWHGFIEQNVCVRLYPQRARKSLVRALWFEFHGFADFAERRVLLALTQQKVAVAPANIRGERIGALRGQKRFSSARSLAFSIVRSRKIQQRFHGVRIERDRLLEGLHGASGVGLFDVVEIGASEEIPVACVRRFQANGVFVAGARVQSKIVRRKCVAEAQVTQ